MRPQSFTSFAKNASTRLQKSCPLAMRPPLFFVFRAICFRFCGGGDVVESLSSFSGSAASGVWAISRFSKANFLWGNDVVYSVPHHKNALKTHQQCIAKCKTPLQTLASTPTLILHCHFIGEFGKRHLGTGRNTCNNLQAVCQTNTLI